MRKAKTEHGYAKLANELAREIARRVFTARQLSILFAVIPETYGFKGRQYAPITPSSLAAATGIDVSNTRKALASLVAERVIVTGPDGWMGINPHMDEWKTESRQVKSTSAMSSQIDPTEQVKTTSPAGSNQPLSRVKSTRTTTDKTANNANLGERKETVKESIKETSLNTPLTPQGDEGETIPFSDPIPEPEDDELPELDSRPAWKKDPAFVAWWNEYPPCRRRGAPECYDFWRKAKLGSAALLPEVMRALAEDKASHQWIKQGGEFVKEPLGWLKKRRWLDDPIEPELTVMDGGKTGYVPAAKPTTGVSDEALTAFLMDDGPPLWAREAR